MARQQTASRVCDTTQFGLTVERVVVIRVNVQGGMDCRLPKLWLKLNRHGDVDLDVGRAKVKWRVVVASTQAAVLQRELVFTRQVEILRAPFDRIWPIWSS